MPKAKTHQATAKRFLIKKSKKGLKILQRTCGQGHFNSRESGNTKRNKRSDITLAKNTYRIIKHAMPNG